MEAHCLSEESISIHGFQLDQNLRRQLNVQGILISDSVKDGLKSGIKFLEHKNDDYIWLKLCRKKLLKRIDFLMLYLQPPSCSS